MPNKDDRKRFLSSPNTDIKELKRPKTTMITESMDIQTDVEKQIDDLLATGQYDTTDNKSLLVCIATAFTSIIKSELSKMQQVIDKKDVDIEQLEKRVNYLEQKLDEQEQYSRRTCIRVKGLKENEGENTDELIVDLAKSMEIDIKSSDIDRSHRIGKTDVNQKQDRSIIVKFTNYKARLKFLTNRRKLTDAAKTSNGNKLSGVYISEDLTKLRMHVAFYARKLKKDSVIKDTWIRDGVIFVKTKTDKVLKFTSYDKINNYKFNSE